jgi:hypothetical protein
MLLYMMQKSLSTVVMTYHYNILLFVYDVGLKIVCNI